jgi:hypothetical protein
MLPGWAFMHFRRHGGMFIEHVGQPFCNDGSSGPFAGHHDYRLGDLSICFDVVIDWVTSGQQEERIVEALRQLC